MTKKEKESARKCGYEECHHLLREFTTFFVERLSVNLGLSRKIDSLSNTFEYHYCKGFNDCLESTKKRLGV